MVVVSSWDSKCDVCGEIELFPIRCKQCGGVYCDTHMPSGKHRCVVRVTPDPAPQKGSKPASRQRPGLMLAAPLKNKLLNGGVLLLSILLLLAMLYFSLGAFSKFSASAGQDPIIGTWKSYEGFTGTDLGDSITFDPNGTFSAKKYLTTSFANPYISDVYGNWTKGDGACYVLAWRPAGGGTGTGSTQLPDTLSYVRYSSDTGSFVFMEQASLRSTGLFPPTVVFKKA